ncbi:oxidoreductase domain protein [Chloroherpeton thalassium ATCC 35110]|uniref:Oxidoreductase domain protein n=1 Tax=Chloroherpeton thalassium (strain ATCC 35110 / GB-78) TaxID=517418 RepID=B3QY64_CHLT3|nr:Gfo/Idh/MocA family oxidoreductase [Chloroherpeton thalassium]ACF15030.1 oxidoreductase domain protein [Chloroherpeton thalassium ATCC 35110]
MAGKHQLNIAVIGVGKLGEFHTKLLKEICAEQKNVHLTGVFDLNQTRAAEIAKKYKTDAFEDFDAIINGCDAAVIATTTSSHFEIARPLLETGKHLFIEKPITKTLDEAERLIALEKAHGCKVQVGHIERFNPALQAVEPYLGTPLYIMAERLSGFSKRVSDVSVILDLMIHDIDLILSIVKSRVINIGASGVSVFSDELDMASARMEFENGAVANVSASRISRTKSRKVRFFSKNPNSYASLDLTNGKSEIFRIVEKSEKRTGSLKEFATEKIISMFGDIGDMLEDKAIEYISPDVPKTNALKCELEAFVSSILEDKPVVVTSHDGMQAVEIAIQISEAIAVNRRMQKEILG